jgi:hypothetical protein
VSGAAPAPADKGAAKKKAAKTARADSPAAPKVAAPKVAVAGQPAAPATHVRPKTLARKGRKSGSGARAARKSVPGKARGKTAAAAPRRARWVK